MFDTGILKNKSTVERYFLKKAMVILAFYNPVRRPPPAPPPPSCLISVVYSKKPWKNIYAKKPEEGEILQEGGVRKKDIFKVSLNYFIYLVTVPCNLLILFSTLFTLGFLGFLKTTDNSSLLPA